MLGKSPKHVKEPETLPLKLVMLALKNPSFLVARVSSHGFSNIIVLGTTSAALCFYPLCYGYPRATMCSIDMLSMKIFYQKLGNLCQQGNETACFISNACNGKMLTQSVGPMFNARAIIASSKLPWEENRKEFKF
jgi:hypothetical protein